MSTPIYRIQCANCRKGLFQYRGEFETGRPVRSRDFFPLPGVTKPATGEPMLCTFCKEPWYMVNVRTGAMIVLTDKGFKPRAPEGQIPLTIMQTMRQRETAKAIEPEVPPDWKSGKSEFLDPSARWRDEKKAEEERKKKSDG